MTKTRLFSDDIACGGCTSSIERGVSEMPGVASVRGSASEKTVDVEYDESVIPVESIIAKLDELGFDSRVVSP